VHDKCTLLLYEIRQKVQKNVYFNKTTKRLIFSEQTPSLNDKRTDERLYASHNKKQQQQNLSVAERNTLPTCRSDPQMPGRTLIIQTN